MLKWLCFTPSCFFFFFFFWVGGQLREPAFTPRGDLTNCNGSLCYRGRLDTDLVYIIITVHMDISDGPFNKPLLGKKHIRFTPTSSSNPILIAHSCGLGGTYWYKHAKVFQAEHLKRLV